MRKIAFAATVTAATAMLCCTAFGATAFAKTYNVSTAAEFGIAVYTMEDGDVLNLTADISGFGGKSFDVAKKATINGNGHTVDFGNSTPIGKINEGASLTINNTNAIFATLAINNCGALIINGGEYKSLTNGYIAEYCADAVLTVSKAKIAGVNHIVEESSGNLQMVVSDTILRSKGGAAGSVWGGRITLNNVDSESEGYTVIEDLYAPSIGLPPTVVINGGSYKGAWGNCCMEKGSSVTFNNVKLELSGGDSDSRYYVHDGTVVVNGGSYTAPEALLFDVTDGTLQINAGTFVAKDEIVYCRESDSTIVINAGSFTSTSGAELISNGCGASITKPADMPASGPYVAKVKAGAVKASVAKGTYTYTGKAIAPAVKATFNGATLAAGTDFTVAYSNNVKVGVAKATVTFADKSLGSAATTFVINPAKASVKSAKAGSKKLSVKMSKKASAYGASGFQISYKVKGAKKWKTVKVTKQSKVIKKLKKGKKYQLKVRAYKKVSGKTYYGAWSKVKTTKKIK